MTPQLLVSIQNAYISFGKTPLFEDLSFNIHAKSRICLVGKNGAGKTTFMDIVAGIKSLDSGKRIELPSISIGYLTQDITFDAQQKVFDYLFSGLSSRNQTSDFEYMVDIVATPLQINVKDHMKNLSGGQLRRIALARSLIENPDLLLLDEPTNHLDLESVQWLENYLRSYHGTLICISHDRTFLKNISNKVFWLDRGQIRICPKGYSYFDEWSQMLLEQEERELNNRKKSLSIEEEWASRGVKARRKRNIRRVEQMKIERDNLKADQKLFRQTMQKIELEPIIPAMSSKILVEFIKVGKEFTENMHNTVILNQFNLRVIKGDKIGIIGNNGSGKTSFLKMLIGELSPDSGKVKLAKNIEFSYFDQKRSNLKLNETLWKNLCPTGGDHINVMGKTRHICGYLKDFLFDPKSAQDPVSILSGGQKNRLMLAKVLANPGNCLILDEPTNDLDMDSLDMLEDILYNYKGTLLIVSHDRDFLDKTVNKTIVFEGNGKVECHIGGYSDYEKEKKIINSKKNPKSNNQQNHKNNVKNKLTYKLQYELDQLPDQIETINKELDSLNKKFSDPNFFQNATLRDESLTLSKHLAKKLEILENRWIQLETMRLENKS